MFQDSVRTGLLGKTATFWLSYMDEVQIVRHFLRATKRNDIELHVSTLRQMCPMFFAFDHQNYARFTTLYYLQMLNLSSNYPAAEQLFCRNGFSVGGSTLPSARKPVDQTIEQIYNRSAKTVGGITGFSRNPSAYYHWSTIRHL